MTLFQSSTNKWSHHDPIPFLTLVVAVAVFHSCSLFHAFIGIPALFQYNITCILNKQSFGPPKIFIALKWKFIKFWHLQLHPGISTWYKHHCLVYDSVKKRKRIKRWGHEWTLTPTFQWEKVQGTSKIPAPPKKKAFKAINWQIWMDERYGLHRI